VNADRHSVGGDEREVRLHPVLVHLRQGGEEAPHVVLGGRQTVGDLLALVEERHGAGWAAGASDLFQMCPYHRGARGSIVAKGDHGGVGRVTELQNHFTLLARLTSRLVRGRGRLRQHLRGNKERDFLPSFLLRVLLALLGRLGPLRPNAHGSPRQAQHRSTD
jgi:hypothetical protein